MSDRTVITASKWDCGKRNYKGGRGLINNGHHNKHCCLGFDGLARGVEADKLEGNSMPREIYPSQYARDWAQCCSDKLISVLPAWVVVEGVTLSSAAIAINDQTRRRLTKQQRAELLRPVFKEAGRTLVFVNDEGGKVDG